MLTKHTEQGKINDTEMHIPLDLNNRHFIKLTNQDAD